MADRLLRLPSFATILGLGFVIFIGACIWLLKGLCDLVRLFFVLLTLQRVEINFLRQRKAKSAEADST